MSLANLQDWAQETFGCAELNDLKRAKRLVVIACDLASSVANSIAKASVCSSKITAAYRFMRNKAIDSDAIAESGYRTTDKLIEDKKYCENKNYQVLIEESDKLLVYENSTQISAKKIAVANAKLFYLLKSNQDDLQLLSGH